jgi:hypothetical protein
MGLHVDPQVHYALQLPPLRYADQLQAYGQQYAPASVPHPVVVGGGNPLLPTAQPSSRLG